MNETLRTIWTALGIETQTISHRERILSALSALAAIAVLYGTSRLFLPPTGAAMLLASMGASAILLFAIPHSALSQPWPLVAGHIVSAAIGVASAKLLPSVAFAAPAAVGIAVLAMHYLRCLHPPAGATALIAVIGGTEVQRLGFEYVLAPVLLDAGILLVCAILFNGLFAWRRYPARWHRPREEARTDTATPSGYPPIAHEDFVYALTQIDTFVDVSEEDLLRIYELASSRSRSHEA